MFLRIVESIAAKILQRMASGRLAFWLWPNGLRFFSTLISLSVLDLEGCDNLSLPDGSNRQGKILVKNTTAETLTIALDDNIDDQDLLYDERIRLPAGSEHEFKVEIPGDSREVSLRLPGYDSQKITLKPREVKEFTADRVFSCANMQFSSYTTSAKVIKIMPKIPEKIVGTFSFKGNLEEKGCQAIAQNMMTGAANAAEPASGSVSNGHKFSIQSRSQKQPIFRL